jgi:CRP-like cAMP-binding protein
MEPSGWGSERIRGSWGVPPERNLLLRALPAPVRDELHRYLRPIRVARQQLLYEAGADLTSVYFPETALVSLRSGIEGPPIQVTAVGSDGVVGAAALSGRRRLPLNAVVVLPGEAKEIDSRTFDEVARAHPTLRDYVLSYLFTQADQIAQEAICNQVHQLAQRCARWILLASNATGAAELRVTHAELAGLLGVGRPNLTIAVGTLQRSGGIYFTRGFIEIVDRAALESAGCECYGIILRQYQALWSSLAPR